MSKRIPKLNLNSQQMKPSIFIKAPMKTNNNNLNKIDAGDDSNSEFERE